MTQRHSGNRCGMKERFQKVSHVQPKLIRGISERIGPQII